MFVLAHLITLVFVIFKLEGGVTWSWFLVLSPMIAAWVIIFLGLGITALFVKMLK